MSFGVGDLVVCVDDEHTALVARGRTYEVEALAGDFVWLVGVVSPTGGRGMFASRFRPVRKTDISIFTSMLAPTPKEKVNENA